MDKHGRKRPFMFGPCVHANLGGRDLGIARVAGPGLGNMLFPWARALLASQELDIPMLYPTWPQLKLGSILRAERDKRAYMRSFVPRRGEIVGLNRLVRLVFQQRIPEPCQLQIGRNEPAIRVFEGLGRFFYDLEHGRDVIAREIPAILTPRLTRNSTSQHGQSVLGVHIRMGDFRRIAHNHTYDGSSNSTIPLNWYRTQIEQFGSRLGREIIVFSDGKDKELSEILSLPGVARAEKRSAIEDILALSRADVIVTSHSTFSYWALFLGSGKAVSHPAVNLRRYFSPAFCEAYFIEAA